MQAANVRGFRHHEGFVKHAENSDLQLSKIEDYKVSLHLYYSEEKRGTNPWPKEKVRLIVKGLKIYNGGTPSLTPTSDRWRGCLKKMVGSFCAVCYDNFYWSDAHQSCRHCNMEDCYHCKSNGDCAYCVSNPHPSLGDVGKCCYGACFSQSAGASYDTSVARCDWCGTKMDSNNDCQCTRYADLSGQECVCKVSHCQLCGTRPCERCKEGYYLYKDPDSDTIKCVTKEEIMDNLPLHGVAAYNRHRVIPCDRENCLDCVDDSFSCATCSNILWIRANDGARFCIDETEKEGYGFDKQEEASTGQRVLKGCSVRNCSYCASDYLVCEGCSIGFLLKIDEDAATRECVVDTPAASWSYHGFGFVAGLERVIKKCQDKDNCEACQADHSKCQKCKGGLGKRVHHSQNECVDCPSDGLFVDGDWCKACHTDCKDCLLF